MAVATEPKQLKPKHGTAFRCDNCKRPLVGAWATVENNPDDPTDDKIFCFPCGYGVQVVVQLIEQTRVQLGLIQTNNRSLGGSFALLILGAVIGFALAYMQWGM